MMIKALSKGLFELCKTNPNIIVLICDDSETYDFLHDSFPDRIINMGISECNAVSVAAGLSSCGYIPYVIGGNAFMAYRAYEFVRDQLCMQNRNVKVIGIGAGMAISFLGNTQHATEDMGALRSLPNLTIMTPSTPTEVKEVILNSINIKTPSFIRVGRASGNDFYNNGNINFQPYKIQEIKKGKDVAIFATGSIVCDALQAADELKERGVDVGVVNVHTVKPIDKEGIVRLSKSYNKWISLEEHDVIGGLGSALSEVIVDENLDVKLEKMGLPETFAHGHGTYDDFKKANGLALENIEQVCMSYIKK
jgi:transketolase